MLLSPLLNTARCGVCVMLQPGAVDVQVEYLGFYKDLTITEFIGMRQPRWDCGSLCTHATTRACVLEQCALTRGGQ